MKQWNAKTFSVIVRERDKVCQHCGSTELLQAHHIEPRANGGSDDPSNGVALCAGCHADEHPDLPRNLFFISAQGPNTTEGWPATYVARLLDCHPRSVVRHARELGITRKGYCWAFSGDDIATMESQLKDLPHGAEWTKLTEEEHYRGWTVSELAAGAGVNGSRIRQLLLAGELKGEKFGPVWVIPDAEAKEWLRCHRRWRTRKQKQAPQK
ncbi:MAG: hypothetical protein FJZ90_08840 [Chloroflexi bacterium]|nr:hypothetical protein [Chloroflexota bacterium]